MKTKIILHIILFTAGMLLLQPNAAQAQISFDAAQTNPFSLTDIGYSSHPAFADLDEDGDMDLMAGESQGNFLYFQNTGTAGAPAFAVALKNPFGLTDIPTHSAPAFADLDGDGDMDLMAGAIAGFFLYFQNTGTAFAPAFTAPQTNPFGLTDIGDISSPTFVDLDGDGDMDLTSGGSSGYFYYLQNTGTASAPAFAAAQTNPFGLTGIFAGTTFPSFVDLDKDGDMDMITGENQGNFFYFQNTGTAAAPAFAAPQTNPFGLTGIDNSAPAFADLDQDGDLDLIAGEVYGNFVYFQNNTLCGGLTVFADADGDSFGDAANSQFIEDCIVPDGYLLDSSDCNDNNASIHPGACDGASASNGVDDNCNGIIDDGFGTTNFYADADGDGYGDPNSPVNECSPPSGYVIDSTDCNDANASTNPGAIDIAGNGIDDNCDGTVDGGNWLQKANFGGTAREYSVGFSIGNKGYIGTGYASPNYYKDFWEFDPSTDAWTQKADFGGVSRRNAAGFSIAGKGYVGTGFKFDGNIYYKDFWEYDPALNTWTQKADYGGKGSYSVAGFSIGSKGYMGTGYYNDGGPHYYKDFWEYDPALDTWTKKADFGGAIRYRAVGFSIGSKGYLGTGDKANKDFYKDFWEYDPAVNTWTQKADFGGGARSIAVGFSISSKGYLGTGYFNDGAVYHYKDFWEYDPALNTWTQKVDFGGIARAHAVGFSIGSKGYIGTGEDNDYLKDFWEYNTGCIGLTVYTDTDGDSYGDISNSLFVEDCIKPDGYVYDNTDCDDANASINPSATEQANGIDDNCDGIIDDGICDTPAGLFTKTITATSAKCKWDPAAGAISYNLRYKVEGSGSWTKHWPSGTKKTINGLSANTNYVWQVRSACNYDPKIKSEWSAEEHFTTSLKLAADADIEIPFSVYPNPASDQTTIHFTLPPHSGPFGQTSHVSIKVYDVSGREMETLLDNEMEEGQHSLSITTAHFSKGVYMVKMISDFGIENQKLIVQ